MYLHRHDVQRYIQVLSNSISGISGSKIMLMKSLFDQMLKFFDENKIIATKVEITNHGKQRNYCRAVFSVGHIVAVDANGGWKLVNRPLFDFFSMILPLNNIQGQPIIRVWVLSFFWTSFDVVINT